MVPVFLLLLRTLTVFISTSTGSASTRYFQALGFELISIIIKKRVLTNGSGILRVKRTTSNSISCDIGQVRKPYYCVIKNGEAEIVEGGLSEVEVDDTVVVSCRKDSVFYYRNRMIYTRVPLYLRQAALDPMKWDIIKLFAI